MPRRTTLTNGNNPIHPVNAYFIVDASLTLNVIESCNNWQIAEERHVFASWACLNGDNLRRILGVIDIHDSAYKTR